MSKKASIFAAAGKFWNLCLKVPIFLFLSIPKVILKSWVPPFIFENLFPLF